MADGVYSAWDEDNDDYDEGWYDFDAGVPRAVGMSSDYYYGYNDAMHAHDAQMADTNGPVEMYEIMCECKPICVPVDELFGTGLDEFSFGSF